MRNNVYVQLKNNINHRWVNCRKAENYEDAVEIMKELESKYPNADFRVLDNNQTTHTK